MALRLRSLAAIGTVTVAAITLAGCGGAGEGADLANGKDKFSKSCGGCHTLKDAGTKGVTGPNLDDAFRGARIEGFKPSTFAGVVRYWIEEPIAPMPANLVTGKDADDVAAYVAAAAGLDKESGVRKPTPPAPTPPAQ